MSDAPCVTVIYGSKKFHHYISGFTLIEYVILLACNFIEQLTPWAILHNQIHVFRIFKSLIILYNVRVIESSEDFHLILDPSCLVSSQLRLIEKFNGNFEAWVGNVVAEKDLSELAGP